MWGVIYEKLKSKPAVFGDSDSIRRNRLVEIVAGQGRPEPWR